MKILMVNESLSPQTGGATLYIRHVCRELTLRGHRITFFHGEKGADLPDAESAECFKNIFGFNYINDRETLLHFEQAVRMQKPDVAVVHQVLNPRIVSFLVETLPAVRFEHGLRLTCPAGRRLPKSSAFICRRKVGWACLRQAYSQRCLPRNPFLTLRRITELKANQEAHKNMSKIIVASEYIKNLLIQNGFDEGQVAVLPYFIYPPASPERRVNWAEPEILFIGRMEPEKGGEYLFRAIERIDRPMKIHIVGEGPAISALKRLAGKKEWPHSTIFHGWVDNNKLASYYERAALLVIPSIWPEPFGINGIEAMSYGVPAAAFDVGGISDWLRNGETGFLAPRMDTCKLAECIESLVANKEKNITMGNRAREIALREYVPEKHMNELENILKAAV